jgi:hypothetical protein
MRSAVMLKGVSVKLGGGRRTDTPSMKVKIYLAEDISLAI